MKKIVGIMCEIVGIICNVELIGSRRFMERESSTVFSVLNVSVTPYIVFTNIRFDVKLTLEMFKSNLG